MNHHNQHTSLSRRNFIKTTGLALSAGLLPSAGPLLAAPKRKTGLSAAATFI